MTTRPVMSLCSVRIGTLNLCLANQKTTGPQAICHGAWSPPFFLLPGQPALLHCLMSDPVRPTWWLVSQSEDRGPPGKSVMAPGPPLPPLPGQPCAFEFFQVYQVAWPTVKYSVPVRLRARGWGERGGEENGPERSGSARQSSVPARPSARDHGDSVPARLRARGWGERGGGGERT